MLKFKKKDDSKKTVKEGTIAEKGALSTIIGS